MAAVLELDKVIKTVVATLANTETLKPGWEELIKLFIDRKDTVLGKSLIISACTVSGKVGSIALVDSADWLKAGPVVSKRNPMCPPSRMLRLETIPNGARFHPIHEVSLGLV